MISRFAVLIFLCFAAISGTAQVDSTFEKTEKALQKEIESFAQENQGEFDQYVDEIDKEFSDYLRTAWEEFNLFAGIKPDTTPKPKILPKYNPAVPKIKPGEVPREIPLEPKSGVQVPAILPIPNLPVEQKPEQAEVPTGTTIPVSFYGATIEFLSDPNLAGTLPSEIHNTTIADVWDKLNKTNYSGLIKLFADARTRMNMNDWGYYLMVKKTAEQISSSKNYSRLLTWFLLTKSGYRVRVAYAENQIALMFPSSNTIYGLRYFMIDQTKFYAPDFPFNQIYTYEKDFPGASKVFDLNVYTALNIGDQYAERPFKFTFQNKEYSFAVKYNTNSVDFYKDFPLCELKLYFDAAISPKAKESILEALKPQLTDRSIPESVDFLLNFVQNGFPYKTDQDQFNGEEKFFFPEEDFYYPFTDCDDRAVLFSYLVKELLKLKVVGVVYPGHVATAIRFPNEEAGDFVIYKGEKYVIADPTYINAPFGLTMPGMVNAKAEIIELLNEQSQDEKVASVWEKAEAGGGLKGDNRQNLCTDVEGNFYLTGYFKEKAELGGTTLTNTNGKSDVFLAKYNQAGNPVWAISGGSEGNAMGYNITLDSKGNIYVCGTFENSISFGKIMTMAKPGTTVFVAKFSPDGKMVWLNQVKPDTTGQKSDFIYATSFDNTGRFIETKYFPSDANFTGFGLSFDPNDNVYYTTTYSGTSGMKIDRISLGFEANFNIISTLKSEIDKEISNNCEKTISGLIAAVNLIRMNNVAISGKEIQQAFDKYNPGFKKTAPTVFDRLGKFQMIRNDAGIVTVLTDEEKPVLIDKMKIANNTRLKVVPLPNGDARFEVLNGVKVGKAFVWFKVNFVRLFRNNGNVLFDYDTDHTQKMMNMKKDMLF
ncbi:MAG: hypothetical protein M0Q38_08695 [Bacteroidales bacterium]|nr:hypothetical protein [Bacteroidales bacterium]